MTVEDMLRVRFGVKDLMVVSKPKLLAELLATVKIVSSLHVELFCLNPDHVTFKDLTEMEKAPLRRERIRRMG